MNIEVKHGIGDIVEHIHASIKYMVIGYEYVDGYGVTYICIEPDKANQRRIYGCELKENKENKIGFISFTK